MSNPAIVWVKSHPITTGAAVIGVIVLFVVLQGAGSGAGAASSSSSGTDAALALQDDAEQFQAGQTASAANYNLSANAQQIAGQIQLAQLSLTGQSNQIAAELQATQAGDALQMYQTQVGGEVQDNTTAATLEGLQDQLTAATAQTQIAAASQVNLAQINANTQIAQANDFSGLETTLAETQASVTNNQTDAAVKIAGINAQVSENATNKTASNGALGIIGSLIGSFF